MRINKSPFTHRLCNKYFTKLQELKELKVTCLSEVLDVVRKSRKAGVRFEESLSDELVVLSEKKHTRLIELILQGFKQSGLYVQPMPRWLQKDYSPPAKTDEQVTAHNLAVAKLMANGEEVPTTNPALTRLLSYGTEARRREYEELEELEEKLWRYEIGSSTDNESLTIPQSQRLIAKVISDELSTTQTSILYHFQDLAGEEPAIDYILDNNNRTESRGAWNEHQRDLAGLPPDTRTIHEKIWATMMERDEKVILEESELETSITSNNDIVSTNSSALTPLLKWKDGVNGLAELLYRLEKGGFIELNSYFSGGGTGVNLARQLNALFELPGSNSIGNLNTCISIIKKSMGTGPIDVNIMRKLGRKKGSELADIVPDIDIDTQ